MPDTPGTVTITLSGVALQELQTLMGMTGKDPGQAIRYANNMAIWALRGARGNYLLQQTDANGYVKKTAPIKAPIDAKEEGMEATD